MSFLTNTTRLDCIMTVNDTKDYFERVTYLDIRGGGKLPSLGVDSDGLAAAEPMPLERCKTKLGTAGGEKRPLSESSSSYRGHRVGRRWSSWEIPVATLTFRHTATREHRPKSRGLAIYITGPTDLDFHEQMRSDRNTQGRLRRK